MFDRTVDGVRLRGSTGTDDLDLAVTIYERRLKRALREANGLPVETDATVGAAADDYLDDVAQRLAPRSLVAVERAVMLLVRHIGAELPARRIGRRHVRAWRQTLEGVARTRLAVFQRAAGWLRWCVQEGYVESDPSAGLAPRERRGAAEIVWLTLDERRALLERLDPPYRQIAVLGLGAGLRAGEACSLHAESVDLERQRIVLVQRDGWTKTGGRTVPLFEGVADELGDLVRRVGRGPLFGSGRRDSVYVSPRAAHHRFVVASEAGLAKRATANVLRHTFATSLLMTGEVTLWEVSHWLGHSDVRTTQSYYGAFVPSGDLSRRGARAARLLL